MKQRRLSIAARFSLGGGLLLLVLCAVFAFFVSSVKPEEETIDLDTGLKVTPLSEAEQGKTLLLKGADEHFTANFFPTLLGAKGDGEADDTGPLKQALELAKQTGGTVYLPQGVYRISQPILIPAGVTLRGEFSSPDAATADRTVFMAEDNEALRQTALFTLEDGANLIGITVYYENQTPGAVLTYPASVSCTGSSLVRNLALINPYHGVRVSGSGTVDLQGIWMSPMDCGILISEQSNRVRMENISISPTYWLNTLPSLFSEKGAYDALTQYLHAHLHGIILEKAEDVTVNRYNVENAAVGLLFNVPAEQQGLILATELTVTATDRPLSLQSLPADGICIADSTFRPTNDTGANTVALGEGVTAPVIFAGCTFAGTPKTVVQGSNPSFLSFYHCDFGTWWNTCFGLTDSTFLAVSPTFRTKEDKATLGQNAFGLLYNAEALEDSSELLFSVSEENAESTAYQAILALKDVQRTLPTELVNAADFGLSTEQQDNSEALKKAIESASLKKAILFIPEGNYRFTNAVSLPKNLHLMGAGHTGTHKTTFTFLSALGNNGGMIRLEEGASLDNLELVQQWKGSDLFLIHAEADQVTLRNLTLQGTRGISLAQGKNAVVEQVNLTVSSLGISLNSAQATLRHITLTDPDATATGIACVDATASLSQITATSLLCGLSAGGTSKVTGTLLTMEGVNKGVLTADSAEVILSALGISGCGEGATSAFLHTTGGSLAVQSMLCRGTDGGNVLLSSGGKSDLRASLFSVAMPITLLSGGDSETKVAGCIWNKTPTYHAAASAGTVTLNGNLLPASAVFEGIEGNYLSVLATESGKVEDGVNVMDFTYIEGEEGTESGSGASDAQGKPPLE